MKQDIWHDLALDRPFTLARPVHTARLLPHVRSARRDSIFVHPLWIAHSRSRARGGGLRGPGCVWETGSGAAEDRLSPRADVF